MSTDTPTEAARRLGPIPIPNNLGPLMLFLVSAIGIGAVFWGRFAADPGIEIRQFDAGPETAILERLRGGEVVAFPDEHLYLVGLEDGRLRVVDGRVEFSGCNVDYHPDDPRGVAHNPNAIPGVLEDPCSGAVWSVSGNAIARVDEPLRTPQFSFETNDDGVRHMLIEVISVGDD